MKIKKKLTAMILVGTILSGVLVGCKTVENKTENSEEKIKVVSTIFPQYDWIRQITEDSKKDIENILLMDSGVDLHSYQPTVADIATILSSDLFIYVGGESDAWVEDVLKQDTDNNVKAINLMELLDERVKEEEIVEGMKEEDYDQNEEHGDEEGEYDEHVWLSLNNAELICKALSDAMSEIDPINAETYENNTNFYVEQLSNLNDKYEEMVKTADKTVIVVGDRFPFRYLVDDYGLGYFAAFSGCSAETEASFDTIIFLSEKVNEYALSHVIVTESSDQKIAKTIIDNTKDKNQQILILNSLQSIISSQADSISYLSVMEGNMSILEDALN